MIRLLLNAGADPRISMYWSDSPLQVAERFGYTEIAEMLQDKLQSNQP